MNAKVIIGNGVIVNTHSKIENECIIDDCVNVPLGGILWGNTNVGESTFIGVNVFVRQNKIIISDVINDAAGVVVKDINICGLYYCNPIKK